VGLIQQIEAAVREAASEFTLSPNRALTVWLTSSLYMRAFKELCPGSKFATRLEYNMGSQSVVLWMTDSPKVEGATLSGKDAAGNRISVSLPIEYRPDKEPTRNLKSTQADRALSKNLRDLWGEAATIPAPPAKTRKPAQGSRDSRTLSLPFDEGD